MNKAMRLLHNGAQLIAIHKARNYKRSDGIALGPGPFVTALEDASDYDAKDDIEGAQSVGMKGVLVQTGKYRENEKRINPQSFKVVQNFSQAVDFILEMLH
ncbi:haloacid dehalogenase hydrolase domain-containing protein 2 isoform X1 [Biomphalaria glabrata]|nr:haloacid dehalogenase hydrolase domain-containing protein 2 isoform X1 [Biomphalaria glabrata]